MVYKGLVREPHSVTRGGTGSDVTCLQELRRADRLVPPSPVPRTGFYDLPRRLYDVNNLEPF